jgi:hypothetical protein
MEESGSDSCSRKGLNIRGIVNVAPRKVIKPSIHIKSLTMKVFKDEDGRILAQFEKERQIHSCKRPRRPIGM